MRSVSQGAVHARAAGKTRVAAQIIWSLTVGAIRFRCLPREEWHALHRFELQVKKESGWSCLCYGSNPLDLLQQMAVSNTVRKAIKL